MSVSKKYNKTSKEIKVTFKVSKKAAQGAVQVFLLCENNGWDPLPLTQQKSGDFKIDVNFAENEPKTEYQYRFRLVMEDGTEKYDNDWEADKYVPNPFEGDNSVVILTEGLKKSEAANENADKAEEKKSSESKPKTKKASKKK